MIELEATDITRTIVSPTPIFTLRRVLVSVLLAVSFDNFFYVISSLVCTALLELPVLDVTVFCGR